ncbi:hypothetical protein MTR67_019585 [Solanum verrucosum]|uniref:DUF4216 domain-containing protein n=1 Tax=Solanum verrucosum TaxID=315347 RepID=A0AAF0TU30_SOLVR|nr:hypothetical protein MTR67_019585 [Solanum verrucosum]
MVGAKSLRIDDLEQVEAQIPITLCKLEKVAQLHKEDDSRIMEDLLTLSRGPTKYVLHYNGYIVNGYRLHAEDYDKNLRTQNCGVVVVGETDKHSEKIDYYEVLTDVLELEFTCRRVVLFECKWFDAYDKTKGVKIDEYGIVSVKWGRFQKINEPFVLVDQASQVFFANDNSNRGWCVARKVQPCDSYEIVQQKDNEFEDLENSSQNKRKRMTEVKFDMKPSKDENEVASRVKATTKYAYVAPGAVGKGRGRGHKSMLSLGVSRIDIPFSPSTDHAYNQFTETSVVAKGRGKGLRSMSNAQGVRTMNKNYLSVEKGHILSFSSTEELMQYIKTNSSSTQGKSQGLKSMCSIKDSENEERSFNQNARYVSQSFSQGLRTMNKKFLAFEKEHMQTDVAFSFSTDNDMESTPTFEPSSCAIGMNKKVRGSNKYKEVASLDIGQKLKVTFYNNRTVGKNSNLFSRHLGKIVRDRNICPLGVSSWKHIKEEKLNHMWAVVKDKFDSDDMNSHRDHVLGWMKELWNKWRGQLHEKYVKGKPIQEALTNMPKGVEKKQWEWKNILLQKIFKFDILPNNARSNRNAINRAKLKMLHHIGSKPIREIIYQKGGKDGNPPDLATIFYETRKKNNTLVDFETIEKHAQIQALVESEPSLSSIEIVEKCFGPQSRSNVFDFGGGVKARDLKGGTSSKAELLAELRSTQKENQSLKDCMYNFQNEMKELKELKELFLAQHPNYQPPIQENDYSNP